MKKLADSTKNYIDEVVAKESSTAWLVKYGISITCDKINYEIYPPTSIGQGFGIQIEIISDNGVNIEYRIKLPCINKLIYFNTEEKRKLKYNREDSQELKVERLINASLVAIVTYLTNN